MSACERVYVSPHVCPCIHMPASLHQVSVPVCLCVCHSIPVGTCGPHACPTLSESQGPIMSLLRASPMPFLRVPSSSSPTHCPPGGLGPLALSRISGPPNPLPSRQLSQALQALRGPLTGNFGAGSSCPRTKGWTPFLGQEHGGTQGCGDPGTAPVPPVSSVNNDLYIQFAIPIVTRLIFMK